MSLKKDFVDDLKAKHLAQFSTADAEDEVIVEGAVRLAAKALIPKRKKIELEPGRRFQIPRCPSCRKRAGRKCGICGVSGRKTEGQDSVALLVDSSQEPRFAEDVAEAPGLMFRCTTSVICCPVCEYVRMWR